MRLYKIVTLLLFSTVIITQTSCKHEVITTPLGNETGTTTAIDGLVTDSVCDPTTVYFQNDVLPILASNCSMNGCHSSASAREGVVTVDYNSVMNSAGVVPNSPTSSELYSIMQSGKMPPFGSGYGPLTADEKTTISNWISQGAINNECLSCDTTNFTFSGSVSDLIATNCKGCHSGNTPSFGVSLTNYTEIAAIATNGRLAGTLDGNGYSLMPPSGALSACQITQIKKWINNGAQND